LAEREGKGRGEGEGTRSLSPFDLSPSSSPSGHWGDPVPQSALAHDIAAGMISPDGRTLKGTYRGASGPAVMSWEWDLQLVP